jgi:23S rRNA pseudouridine955/2504/2580 synthase
MREITIGPNDSGQRMDKFLLKAVPSLPQSLIYKYLRTKRIKCNGKRCENSSRLQVGDKIQLFIADEFFLDADDRRAFLAASDALNILYEDNNILLLNKPVGLVVHEDSSNSADTLINRVQHYLFNKGEYLPESENSFAPALCNRIDRNTQGIVIAAKNAEALRILNQKIKDRKVHKFYLCIVHGRLSKKQDTLSAFLRKDSSSNQVQVFDQQHSGCKTILTKYRVLQVRGRFSLVEVELLTGRTHQIRAHFSHIGHPLLGDGKYGFQKDNQGSGFSHQALCAYKLQFDFSGDSDAGCLQYLDGKCFEIQNVSFRDDFLNGKFDSL